MLNTLVSLTILGTAALTTLIAVDWRKSIHNSALLSVFLAVLFLDNLILVGVDQIPALQVIPNGQWGSLMLLWSGKLYSVIVGLVVALLIRQSVSFHQIGLTLHQNEGSLLPSILALIGASMVAGWIAWGWEKGPFDLAVLIYLSIMPGINEELVYRGLLLGILDRIQPPAWTLFGAKIGWGAYLTAMIFGLLHGFWVGPDFTWVKDGW